MRAILFAIAVLAATPCLASDPLAPSTHADEHGTLNPDEMTIRRSIENALRGDVDMVTCAQGYIMTKSGRHEEARIVFENCAKKGWTGTMTWMSYMEDNGFGAPEDARKAAEWDRKAAELGDPVGKFNYGLDLLRGRGVERDPELGKAYVDEAARMGFADAIELRDSGYDWDVVTPDADNWKYQPLF